MKTFLKLNVIFSLLIAALFGLSSNAFACETCTLSGTTSSGTVIANDGNQFTSCQFTYSAVGGRYMRIDVINSMNPFIGSEIHDAISEMLQESWALFGYPALPFTVRIVVPSCWQDIGGGIWQPCDATDCCEEDFTLTYDGNYCFWITSHIPVCTQHSCTLQSCTCICDGLDEWDNPEVCLTVGSSYFTSCTECLSDFVQTFTSSATYPDIVAVSDIITPCPDPAQFIVIRGIEVTGSGVPFSTALQEAATLSLYKVGKEVCDRRGGGNYNITFVIPSCYKLQQLGSEWWYLPCSPPTSCCEAVYSVDVYYDPLPPFTFHNLVSQILMPSGTPICTTPPCTNDACLYNPWALINGYVYPRKVTEDIPAVTTNSTTTVKPDPTTGMTGIYIESDITGKITLDVIDISGNSVLRMDLMKNSHEGVFYLDMTKFPNGSYNYRIMQDGKSIVTGKFVLIH